MAKFNICFFPIICFFLCFFLRFWLFRAWGRTGTAVGSTKAEAYFSYERAYVEFHRIYQEKTDNDFAVGFKKMAGKFHHFHTDDDKPEDMKAQFAPTVFDADDYN